MPTKNWQTGYFPEGAKDITGTTMYDTIMTERDTCFACAVRCKGVVEVPGMVDPRYGGPEYETVSTFGSYCGVTSLEHVSLANQLCNMILFHVGYDCLFNGMLEKGLIDEKDTEGIKLNFGNEEALA